MANKIATTYQYDDNGVKYTLDIYHQTDSTSTITFNGVFSLSQVWDGTSADQLFGVYKCRVDVELVVEDSSQLALLPIVVSSYENDIYCELYRSPSPYSVNTLIFKGYLLQDVVQRDNATYPFGLRLTFTDSLGRAGEVEWSSDIIGNIGVIQLLRLCLADLEVDALYGVSENILRTTPGYLPDTSTSPESNDPYSYIYLNIQAFYDDPDSTSPDKPKVEKILSELCRLFNSRLYYSDGLYHFECLDIRMNSTFGYWLYYKTTGGSAVTGYANPKLPINHSTHKIQAGATITYLPPIKQAECSYNTEVNNYLMGIMWNNDYGDYVDENDLTEVCYLVAQDDNYLKIKFTHRFQFDIDSSFDGYTIYYRFRAKIKCGSYWYVKDYDETFEQAMWSGTEGWFYFTNYVTNSLAPLGWSAKIGFTTIIDTLPLEGSGVLKIYLEYVGVGGEGRYVANEPYFTSAVDEFATLSMVNEVNSLSIMNEEGEETTGLKYVSENNQNNSKILEYNGILLDYPGSNSIYSVLWDTVGTPEATDGWDVIGESPAVTKDIQEQTLRSIVQFRQTTREQHAMAVEHTESYFTPFYLVQYKNDGTNYEDHLIMRLDFDLLGAISQIDMFHIEKGSNEPTVTETTKKKGIETGVGLSVIDETEPSPEDDITGIKTTAFIESGVAITVVSIDGLDRDMFEGDTLKIYSPAFRQYLEVMLSSDAEIDDTTLNIFEVTPSYDYIIGSLVIPAPRKTFKYQKHIVTTEDYLEPTVNIPDFSVLSDNAIRRKVRVYYQDQRMNWVGDGNTATHPMEFGINNGTNRIELFGNYPGRYITEIEN